MDDECLRIRPDASTVYPPDGVKDNLRRWESRAVPSECPWRGERSAPSAVFQVLIIRSSESVERIAGSSRPGCCSTSPSSSRTGRSPGPCCRRARKWRWPWRRPRPSPPARSCSRPTRWPACRALSARGSRRRDPDPRIDCAQRSASAGLRRRSTHRDRPRRQTAPGGEMPPEAVGIAGCSGQRLEVAAAHAPHAAAMRHGRHGPLLFRDVRDQCLGRQKERRD